MADWAKLKVVDLKAELKRRGLPQAGLKTELVARLEEADQQPAEPSPEEKVEDVPDEPSQPVDGDDAEALEAPDDNKHADTVQNEVPDPEPETAQPPEPVPETEPEPEPKHESESLPARQPEPQTEPHTEQEKPVESEQTPQAPEPSPAENAPVAQKTESQSETGTSARDSQTADPDILANQELTRDSASIEAPAEVQKRKRRSASPTPKEDEVARKRARADLELSQKPNTHQMNNSTPPPPEIDYDRHVEPSVHPATSALYISNLMRPLRPADLRAHITTLASASGATSTDTVTKFYLDFIRTHAFVALDSVSAASRVRQLLHGCVWPNESNRKPLSIDFIPPEKIDTWIDMEEEGGRRPGTRWEVTYSPTPDGSTVEANLVSNALSSTSALPPSKPQAMVSDSINGAPLGPRSSFTEGAPPTGPRGPRRGQQQQQQPLPPIPSGESQYTRARPVVAYRLVSEDLAQSRIKNMRTFYTRDLNRDLGREINRYSFEDGDSFVDRGREIFEGIRPPHRERGGGRGGGGRGRGGGGGRSRGGFRPRSDRYIPGGGGRERDDDDRRRF